MIQPEHQSNDFLLSFVPEATADGSYTFFSSEFGEAFHSRQGARLEAELKFVKPTQLAQVATQSTVCLLDVCYGLGYNTAAALDTIWRINPTCHVQWFGLELDARVPKEAIAHNLLSQWPDPIPQLLTQLVETGTVINQGTSQDASNSHPPLTAHLLLGDARQTIQQVHATGFQADAIFLDPFSPVNCPQLWTAEFLDWVVRCLAPTGRLATYSCSAAVRTALQMAGLQLGYTPGVGRKSPGTIASFDRADIPPLSLQEQEHLHTRAAIPYRDPPLSDTMEVIIQRRRQEQAHSQLETTSQWKKRWVQAKNDSAELP